MYCYVVNKSDLTDKRDLTGLSVVGQEKSFLGKSAGVMARKIGAKKARRKRDGPFTFYRIISAAMASKRPRLIKAALKSINAINAKDNLR